MIERQSSPNSTDFFEKAIEAYGCEGAQQICEKLIESLDHDRQQIPLLSPISGLQLLVHSPDPGEVTAVWGAASSPKGIIKLAFDANAAVEEVVATLPLVAAHELTHVAHYQHNPAVFQEATLWSYTVREGVAMHKELSSTEEYFSGRIYNYDPTTLASIDDTLIDVLFNPGENQRERHYEYLQGDGAFPDRGYEVGVFLVAKMILQRGDDLATLFALSLDDWREFAEHEL